jgi:hypothetical protein
MMVIKCFYFNFDVCPPDNVLNSILTLAAFLFSFIFAFSKKSCLIFRRNLLYSSINFLELDSLSISRSQIYCIVSPSTSLWYIGETGRSLLERIREHFLATLSPKKKKATIYELMSCTGPSLFCILPITYPNYLYRHILEKSLITEYRPSLNTRYISSIYSNKSSLSKFHLFRKGKSRPYVKERRANLALHLDNRSLLLPIPRTFDYLLPSPLLSPTFYKLSTTDTIYVDFLDILLNSTTSIIHISITKNHFDLTSWPEVFERFGDSTFIYPLSLLGDSILTRKLELRTRILDEITLLISQSYSTDRFSDCLSFVSRLNYKYSFRLKLRDVDDLDLFNLLKTTKRIIHRPKRLVAQSYIQKEIFYRFHFYKLPHPLIRLLDNPFITYTNIKPLITLILTNINIPSSMSKKLLLETRSVRYNLDKLGTTLCNHIKISKSEYGEFPCACNASGDDDWKNHLISTEPVSDIVTLEVISRGAHARPWPDIPTITKTILPSLSDFCITLAKFKKISRPKPTPTANLSCTSPITTTLNPNNNPIKTSTTTTAIPNTTAKANDNNTIFLRISFHKLYITRGLLHLGMLSEERACLLWKRFWTLKFRGSKTMRLSYYLPNFYSSLLNLLEQSKLLFRSLIHSYFILPDSFYEFLTTTLDIKINRFCTSLCVYEGFEAFSSPLPIDSEFGSIGDPFDTMMTAHKGFIFPPIGDIATIIKLITYLISATFNNQPVCNYILLPTDSFFIDSYLYDLYLTLTSHPSFHTIAVIPTIPLFNCFIYNTLSPQFNSTFPLVFAIICNDSFLSSLYYRPDYYTIMMRNLFFDDYNIYINPFFPSSLVDLPRPCPSLPVNYRTHIYGKDFYDCWLDSSICKIFPLVIYSIVPPWPADRFIFNQQLWSLGFANFDMLDRYLSIIYSDIPSSYPSELQPKVDWLNASMVSRASSCLSGLVSSYLDKNNNKFIFMCPVRFYGIIDEVFINNKIHFVVEKKSPDSIIKNWLDFFELNEWSIFGSFKKNGSLPYSYPLVKSKDFGKYRPLTSYFNHPMKKILSLASRAIFALLKKLPDTIHFELFKTQALMERLDTIKSSSGQTFGDNTRFLILPGDIKDMFFGIPHLFILNALFWLLELTAKSYRRKRVAVRIKKLNDGNDVIFGRSYNNYLYVEFTFDDIVNIVMFDLNNAFFTILNYVLRQLLGIPMGSPTSPPLAILVCSYSEYSFLSTLGVDRRLLSGVRYMDDCCLFIVYDADDVKSFERAYILFYDIIDRMYPKEMKLVVDYNNPFPFLQSTITTYEDKSNFHVSYFNKNKNSILSPKISQKIIRYQHWFSCSSPSVKRGVIITTILSICRFSEVDVTRLMNAIYLIIELRYLAYPWSQIEKAFRMVKLKHGFTDLCEEAILYIQKSRIC